MRYNLGHVNYRILYSRAISSQLFELRSRQKLTQKELALKVGTTQSVIARLEDSNYDGHSLNMLSRIARVLGYTVVVQFEPAGEAGTARGGGSKTA